MANSSGDSYKHVAVLAFPFSSHPGLILRLVRRMAAASPEVTFSFFSTAKANKSLFAGQCPHNVKPFDVYDGMSEGHISSSILMGDEFRLFWEVADESFREALDKAVEEIGLPITCLVADSFLWFTAEMAEQRGVPWVVLWTSGACYLSIHLYAHLIRDTLGVNGLTGREDEKQCFVPGLPEIRLGDLPPGLFFKDLESHFSIMQHKIGQILLKAEAVQINSFEELEPDITKDLKLKLKSVRNIICPLDPESSSYTDEYECIQWLDKQETSSVAYIGFGSFITLPPHELMALAESFEESDIPFLWSLKANEMILLPPGFVERTGKKGKGKIVLWAPQVQVLGHRSVGVLFTHGGWNSILESIASGVPIIGRPFFADQMINTWLVESVWRIGVRIQGGTFMKSGTMDALQQVFSSKKGEEFKENIVYYKELALKAAEPNGSSTQNLNALIQVITGQKQ